MTKILGVRYGHDAAATLVINGDIVSDIAEERLTRKKNDGSFPEMAIQYCLDAEGITSLDLDAIAVPTNSISPLIKAFFPEKTEERKKTIKVPFLSDLSSHLSKKEKEIELPCYYSRYPIRKDCKIIPVHHHLAHAASAYYTSGFYQKSLVVVMDGRGDEYSTSIWRGVDNRLLLLKYYDSNSSLAWFYAAATEALGWRHGSDEWKTMGLAPYGSPRPGSLKGYFPVFKQGKLLNGHDFGNPGRFPDHGTNHYHLPDSIPLAEKIEELGRENFAAEVQRIVEEQGEEIIYPWLEREKTRLLCCAGGFFLNVKFNQKIWYSGKVEHQWTYPNPGDSGLSAGCALYAYYSLNPLVQKKRLQTMYYGPSFTNNDILTILTERKLKYLYHDDITQITAKLLSENKIIAWFQGRMESGPRALGNRSILMSPMRAENKDVINACVKYREAFRPFTPSILFEFASDYLDNSREELFMITSFNVKNEIEKRIPAVVHVDGTTRPQMVKKDANPLYYDLIKKFGEISGEYVLLNTSFNIKGEPIVCNPREAIKCFYDTGLDVLVMGNYMLMK